MATVVSTDTTLPLLNAEEIRAAILRRAKALGWSQAALARRIRKDKGHVCRALRDPKFSKRILPLVLGAIEREEARRRAAAPAFMVRVVGRGRRAS